MVVVVIVSHEIVSLWDSKLYQSFNISGFGTMLCKNLSHFVIFKISPYVFLQSLGQEPWSRAAQPGFQSQLSVATWVALPFVLCRV